MYTGCKKRRILGKDLCMIHRVIPILIYLFVLGVSIYLPAVFTSLAKAPF